ncbi:MAG: SDR family oxidoreductase [Flavobacteriaceae bacterium]|jgi:NADP-dependent 3-hydroxy acid dehydrogenase YdfG|nr:SDR family oxidoreductase [Flavobacteriaceae bacterium]
MHTNKKVVYITGGTKGIGKGIAEALLNNGYRVAISGRNGIETTQIAQSLGDSSVVLGLQSDVRTFADEQNAIAQTIAHFGKVDIVIANAGVGIFAPVHEMTLEEWNTMIDTNLTGVFHTLKASVEQLKQNKGYFISIASLAGINFFANGAGYNASKFGVVGFSQAAMLDLRNDDVKVTTILPGSVTSNFNNHIPSDADSWKIQPEDMGELIVDLLKMNPRVLPSKIEIRPTKTK